jgi:hypothetical protein
MAWGKGINHLVKVSDEDRDLLDEFIWSAHGGSKSDVNKLVYARRVLRVSEGKGRAVLHRVILERVIGRKLDPKEHVDHIDYDGLNNTRENLRIISPSLNIGRARIRRNNTSGMIGVSWSKSKECWVAQINCGGKYRGIGNYKQKEHAQIAYDAVSGFIRKGFL